MTRRATTGLGTKLGLLVRARREDDRWTATSVRDLHAGTDPAARELVTVSGLRLANHPAAKEQAPELRSESAVGRVTDILLRLHAEARLETRRRREAARDKVASLA